MTGPPEPVVWFPAIRCGNGVDVFTRTLADQLRKRGLCAEITWLSHHAEYAPWAVPVPRPPAWANVVHVNTWLHPRFVPRGLAVVATIHHAVHDRALLPYNGWPRATYHRAWIAPNERSVPQRANRVVAVSRHVAETARRTLLNVPMEVVYNGIDTATFRPGNRRRKSGEPFRLLYVGSWIVRKGVDLLVPIMRELGDGFELHYTGGPQAAEGRSRMPLNLRGLGRLSADAVVAATQDADALLFPSRSEGPPLSVIEAMACGLPVIATRGSALVEVVDDGATGLLCAQDDVAAFAAAARCLAEDPRACRRHVCRGAPSGRTSLRARANGRCPPRRVSARSERSRRVGTRPTSV